MCKVHALVDLELKNSGATFLINVALQRIIAAQRWPDIGAARIAAADGSCAAEGAR